MASSCPPLEISEYFIKWVWRGRDEKSRTVEKSEIGRGDQKLKETCFWDFHIPVGMAQRVWPPSFFWKLTREKHHHGSNISPELAVTDFIFTENLCSKKIWRGGRLCKTRCGAFEGVDFCGTYLILRNFPDLHDRRIPKFRGQAPCDASSFPYMCWRGNRVPQCGPNSNPLSNWRVIINPQQIVGC